MKKILCVVLILSSIRTFSQDKNLTIELKGRSYLEKCIDLGDGGIIFQESWANVVNKQPGAVHHYSSTGELKWRKPVTIIPGKTFVTASPDGSIVYHVELKGAASVLQIKEDGSHVEKELPDLKGFSKNLTAIFCDKSYLYFLSTLNGDQFSEKKRATEKLVVQRFSNKDFAYKQFTMDLPPITSGKNTSFWSFFGQKDDQKYLLSKEVDLQAGTIKFSIVSFTPDGVVVKKINLTNTVDADQELVSPTNYTDESNGAAVIQNMDRHLLGLTSRPGLSNDMTGGGVTETYAETNGVYAAAYFDPKSEQLYMITVLKPKGSKTFTNLTFQVSQYNLNEDLLWKSTIKHAKGASTFALHILPRGSINLTVYSESGVRCEELSPKDGKTVATQNIEYKDGDNHTMESNWKWRLIKVSENGKILRSAQYIATLPADERKSGVFGNFVNSTGEMVVVAPKKGDTRLLYFKN